MHRPRTPDALRALLRAAAAAALLAAALPAAQAQGTPAADALLARNLAATCANCHGTDGQARGDMKPLAGVPAAKIVALVAEYRSGALPATVMHQIAKGYTEQQIQLVADYFAARKP